MRDNEGDETYRRHFLRLPHKKYVVAILLRISKAEVEWKHYNPGNKLSMLS
jgi:hypothetical protein